MIGAFAAYLTKHRKALHLISDFKVIIYKGKLWRYAVARRKDICLLRSKSLTVFIAVSSEHYLCFV